MVKKKTAEELAEERAKALEQRAEEWRDMSAKASADLSEDEKALEELKKRIALKKRTVGKARKYVQEKVAIEFYNKVINAFGLTEKEKKCKTEEDFNNLLKDVLEKIEDIGGLKKENSEEADIVKETPAEKIKPKYPFGEIEDEYENGIPTPVSYKPAIRTSKK